MRPSIGFTSRLWRAVRLAEAETGEKINQTRLGDLAAAELGRAEPFNQTTASSWLTKGVRDVDVIWALARVTGVRFAWLAAGELPMTEARQAEAEPDFEERPLPRRPAEEVLAEVEAERERERPAVRPAVANGDRAKKPGEKPGVKRRRPGSR